MAEVWLIWDEGDYYGPDPADEPWVFVTEAAAQARLAELVDYQKALYPQSSLPADSTYPYKLERIKTADSQEPSDG